MPLDSNDPETYTFQQSYTLGMLRTLRVFCVVFGVGALAICGVNAFSTFGAGSALSGIKILIIGLATGLIGFGFSRLCRQGEKSYKAYLSRKAAWASDHSV